MRAWTAVVPLKVGVAGKSRLDGVLPATQRVALIAFMAQHVLAVLKQVPAIGRIVMLSAERPDWWTGDWAQDRSDGLNEALELWRFSEQPDPILVIHGDLPFVQPCEIKALLDAAEQTGISLATDRAGTGTNALALIGSNELAFRFGPGSRLDHLAERSGCVIELPGLMDDIDDPRDLAQLRRILSRSQIQAPPLNTVE